VYLKSKKKDTTHTFIRQIEASEVVLVCEHNNGGLKKLSSFVRTAVL